VSILDGSGREIIVLGADLTDLVIRVRYRANELGLDRPDLRLPRAFAAVLPGDTIRVRVQQTRDGYSLLMDGHAYTPLRHTPGEGWALLFHPEHTAPWIESAFGLSWVAGPLILAGWWAPSLGWAAGALSLALAGMAFGAHAAPLTHMTAAEVLAALGGILLGVALRRRLCGTDAAQTTTDTLAHG